MFRKTGALGLQRQTVEFKREIKILSLRSAPGRKSCSCSDRLYQPTGECSSMTSQVALQWPLRTFRRTQWSAVAHVAHGVLHSPPRRLRSDGLRLHARLPILALQPGDLLVAIDGRAVPVRHLQQPLHGGRYFLGTSCIALHHNTIGLDAFEVPPGHLRQSLADPRHCDVLGPHDVVVHWA